MLKFTVMLSSDLKRLLSSFKECDVCYLLADGFRYEKSAGLKLGKQIDIWIKPSLDNARRIIRALKIYGTPMHGVLPEKLAGVDTQFTLNCRTYMLEFYTYIPGLIFDLSFESRELCREGSLYIPLLNAADLALAKVYLTRPPDDKDPDVDD